jgi:hypothetical protein
MMLDLVLGYYTVQFISTNLVQHCYFMEARSSNYAAFALYEHNVSKLNI